MCLIVLAHRVSEEFPLVLAANREEDYNRPTLPTGFWDDRPDILGGRDALHGGSWLAITRGGRFAAVTNLAGAVRSPGQRSRGELVGDFVRGNSSPMSYVESISADDYAGFHLFVGQIGGTVAQLSGSPLLLEPGIHGLSNAPAGVRWPKVELAEAAMQQALAKSDPTEPLLTFLIKTPAVFIAGERYGTRSSTVIVATRTEVLFIEQNFERGGAIGERHELRFAPGEP